MKMDLKSLSTTFLPALLRLFKATIRQAVHIFAKGIQVSHILVSRTQTPSDHKPK